MGISAKAAPAPGFRDHPDYPWQLEPHAGDVIIIRGGVELARTASALALKESRYPTVFYIPREHVNMELLSPTEDSSYCPFKGRACYWSFQGAKAAWSYEEPFDESRALAGYLAFYPED